MELLFVLIVAIALLLVLEKRPAANREPAWTHPALRGKSLVYSERKFVAKRHGIVAKIDRGYLAGDTIELLELKTRARHRVFASDVIELSTQRIAVEDQDGRRVSDAGYVLTESRWDGSRKLHQVTLLSREQLLAVFSKMV